MLFVPPAVVFRLSIHSCIRRVPNKPDQPSEPQVRDRIARVRPPNVPSYPLLACPEPRREPAEVEEVGVGGGSSFRVPENTVEVDFVFFTVHCAHVCSSPRWQIVGQCRQPSTDKLSQ
jgi:hypothetical protein